MACTLLMHKSLLQKTYPNKGMVHPNLYSQRVVYLYNILCTKTTVDF